MQFEIRVAEIHDLEPILDLFNECVLSVCRADYSDSQLKAWASASANTDRWIRKINDQFFIVALNEKAIVGFGSLEGRDTIDLLYVHKDFQRLGVADELFSEIRKRAEQHGARELKADVSKTAKGFFERKGFHVIESQQIERDGVSIGNFRMSKGI